MKVILDEKLENNLWDKIYKKFGYISDFKELFKKKQFYIFIFRKKIVCYKLYMH